MKTRFFSPCNYQYSPVEYWHKATKRKNAWGMFSSILEKAKAEIELEARKAAEKLSADERFRKQMVIDLRKQKEDALRAKKQRSGTQIAEGFLAEIAPAFLRMMERDSSENIFSGIKIVLRPYKGEHGAYSMHVEDGVGKTQNYPSGEVRKLAERAGDDGLSGWEPERLIKKLKADDDGFSCSTVMEMLEEIDRLRQLVKLLQHPPSENNPAIKAS